MKFYIDTDSFHAVPTLYADAAKNKPLPRQIPVVEGWAQELEIGFLGSRVPVEGDKVALVLAPPRAAIEVARSTEGVRKSDGGGVVSYTVLMSMDTSAMRALFGGNSSLSLVAGVLVTNPDAGTRIEYQFNVSIHESVVGVWESPVSMAEMNLALGETRTARDAAQLAAEAALRSESAAKSSEQSALESEQASALSEQNAGIFEREAKSARDVAINAQDAVEKAKLAAEEAAQTAGNASASALQSAESALESKQLAEAAATDATSSSREAETSATHAGESAQDAAESATFAGQYKVASEAAKTAAEQAKMSAEAAKSAAQISQGQAAQSAADAAQAASGASASEKAAQEAAALIGASAKQIGINEANISELKDRVSVLENTAVGKIAYGRLFSSDIDPSGKLIKIKVVLSDTGTPITTYTSGYFSTSDGGETQTWVDETGIRGTVWQIIDTFNPETEEVGADYVSGDGWTSSTRDAVTTYLRAYDPANPGAYTVTSSRQGIVIYVEKVVATTSDEGTIYVKSTGTRTIDIDASLGSESTWFKEIAPFSTARTKHIPVTIDGTEYDNVMTEMDPVFMNRIPNFALSVPVKDSATGEILDTTEISGELWVYTCDEGMTFEAKIDGVDEIACTFFRAPTFVDYDRAGALPKGYFGRYEASKLTASTGAILVSQPTHQNPAHTSTRYDFLTMARRSNAGTNPEFEFNARSWSIEPLEDLHLLGFLLVIMSGNRNTQATFTGRTGQDANVDYYSSCGDCDGLLDENLQRVLTAYGYPEGVVIPGSWRARTSNLSSFCFFVENLYGSKWKHRPDVDVRSITAGTIISDTLTAEGDYAYLFHCHDRAAYDCYFHPDKALTRDGMTYPANPHSARFSEEGGYVNTGVKWPLGLTSGYYGVAAVRSEATPWMLLPSHPRPASSSGAATHGLGDCVYTTATANVTSATSVYSMSYVITGGSYYYGPAAGAFALRCYSYWDHGAVSNGVRASFSLQGQGSGATAQ